MKEMCWARALVWLTLLTPLAGCSHKQDAKTELEKAAAIIAQDNNAQPAPPPADIPRPDPTAAAPAPAPDAPAPLSNSQEMQQALVSYKTGQLEDAVTRLQKLRRTTTLTPEQRMALQDSVAAVMREIYAMAEKGDSRAIQAVRQYEEMQSAPRH